MVENSFFCPLYIFTRLTYFVEQDETKYNCRYPFRVSVPQTRSTAREYGAVRLSPGHGHFLAVESQPVPHHCGLNRPVPCGGNAPSPTLHRSDLSMFRKIPIGPTAHCSDLTLTTDTGRFLPQHENGETHLRLLVPIPGVEPRPPG